MLYSKAEWVIESQNHPSLFDLHLIFFRSISNEAETKLDINLHLEELKRLGYMKNYKHPVFILKDNRQMDINKKNEEICNDVEDIDPIYNKYKEYLPRANVIQFLKNRPVK
jgi:hypothetical protein